MPAIRAVLFKDVTIHLRFGRVYAMFALPVPIK
jgi:hypothetical protein